MTTTARHLVPVRISPALVRLVEAPGFTASTFARSLERARTVKAGYFRIVPAGGGRVMVNGGSEAWYVVSRHFCQCAGHRACGHCYHRAGAIAAQDLYDIDLCRETVLGFDEQGRAVTTGYDERMAAA